MNLCMFYYIYIYIYRKYISKLLTIFSLTIILK